MRASAAVSRLSTKSSAAILIFANCKHWINKNDGQTDLKGVKLSKYQFDECSWLNFFIQQWSKLIRAIWIFIISIWSVQLAAGDSHSRLRQDPGQILIELHYCWHQVWIIINRFLGWRIGSNQLFQSHQSFISIN